MTGSRPHVSLNAPQSAAGASGDGSLVQDRDVLLVVRDGPLLRSARLVVVVVGVLLTGFAVFLFVLEPDLSVVDPRVMEIAFGGGRPDSAPGGWESACLLTAAGLLACAGLPPRPGGGVPGPVDRTGQICGSAAALLACAVGSLMTTVWTHGPDDPCRYASCWPAEAQALAIAGPAVVAAAGLALMALLATRVSWRVRAVVPAALWLASVAALRLAWEPYLLPVYLSPP